MLTFIERISCDRAVPLFTLSLTAEERTRSRHRFETPDAQELFLRLPRGTVLQDRDLLRSQSGEIIQIIAKAEPVLTVTARHPLDLLKAAYHLGNRHVSLEIAPTYLRLSPDSVLKGMLEHLGVTIIEEIAPFQPEIGAYHGHDR
ncbi:MAG: urease accessory protein UreE [Hydrococcus sp. Prado102]|jgi:urease accessory protein|nr:urease accessory protein UreE [Hydrococcus sp. Prado102]